MRRQGRRERGARRERQRYLTVPALPNGRTHRTRGGGGAGRDGTLFADVRISSGRHTAPTPGSVSPTLFHGERDAIHVWLPQNGSTSESREIRLSDRLRHLSYLTLAADIPNNQALEPTIAERTASPCRKSIPHGGRQTMPCGSRLPAAGSRYFTAADNRCLTATDNRCLATAVKRCRVAAESRCPMAADNRRLTAAEKRCIAAPENRRVTAADKRCLTAAHRRYGVAAER